ncbi:MAG: glycosyltransferase [Vulcanimicrobiaceae bacterium]
MNVLVWHVHGSWMTSFVQGPHTYYVPVEPGRGPDGRGRAQTYVWPANVVEVDLETSRRTPYDVVVLQRPHELDTLAAAWLGPHRRLGSDVPAIYVEHDAPPGSVTEMRHRVAERADVTLVHVTNFNALFWESGRARTHVIEHAIVDPGHRYTGDIAHTAVVINEAARRGRIVGTDLLERFATVAPIDLFGMGAGALGGFEDVPQARLHDEMAKRRVYLHPNRWTSLGLSLLEAMYLGMPVVALATTEAHEAIPPGAGACSTSIARAREYARTRYALARFVRDWNDIFSEVAA